VACIDAFRRNGIGTNLRVSRSAYRADGGWHRAGCRRLFRKWQFDFHPAALADRRRRLRRPAEALHPQPPRISLGTVRLAGSLFCALPGVFGVHLCRADLPAPNDLARFGAPLRARAMPRGLDARNGHEAATGSVKCATSTRLPKIRSQSGTCSRSRTMPLARSSSAG
jgi:hypothetical protein